MTERDENGVLRDQGSVAEPRLSNRSHEPITPEDEGEDRYDRAREHRRRRLRRHGRRAYIRSVYFLPSLCTLGNAICGFGAIYVAGLDRRDVSADFITQFFAEHHFVAASYLIFLAMLFDALDGRLARFARHTTDFGGQLDSLADVISFGVAPAIIMLEVFKFYHPSSEMIPFLSRLIWSIGALYMSCAAMRLARFNVSNEHGEQHHFSFLGLPSPGAGGTVVAMVLMQQEIAHNFGAHSIANQIGVWVLPIIVLMTGLLMISNIRYPHLVNRYMRGKKSIGALITVVSILLLFVVAHRYVLAFGTLIYSLWGLTTSSYLRIRRKSHAPLSPKV